MKLKFTKMQGAGNDYVYLDCFQMPIPKCPKKIAVALSDRHFGVGADGMVLICPAENANAAMRMFNADGSEGKMCGNAIRCVAKYLYENKIVQKPSMTIATKSGNKQVTVFQKNGIVHSAQVDMGAAVLRPEKIPVRLPGKSVISCPVTAGGNSYDVTCVSMGNPHAVIFCEQVDTLALAQIGPLFEHHEIFPQGVNAEFVHCLAPNVLQARVWERGSGETMACGTGACAAAVAAVLNGYCTAEKPISVQLPGGTLTVIVTQSTVLLQGPCATVFEGEIEL